jgi:vitamin K-dependent gamma-carboxylase
MTTKGETRKRNTPSPKASPTTKPKASKQDDVKPTAKPEKPITYKGQVFKRFLAYLFEEEDAGYLAVFRILWGSIMAYEAFTYTIRDFGKMQSSFYNSTMQFKYYGFEWCVVPENEDVLKAMIVLQMLAGIGITLGFLYRLSTITFFLLFGYMYMLEQAMYLNHFYLVCILSAMMILLPCNCLFSIDALIWPKTVYSPTAPK